MLRFACTGSRPEPYAAGPSVQLDLRVTADEPVHTVALRTQIRIEPRRRRYTPSEQERLTDLFGEPARWGDTLNPLQLATVATMVPGFTGSTTVPLAVPLTYDLDVAAAKYLHGLDDGDVPLLLLFSGTVFRGAPDRVVCSRMMKTRLAQAARSIAPPMPPPFCPAIFQLAKSPVQATS